MAIYNIPSFDEIERMDEDEVAKLFEQLDARTKMSDTPDIEEVMAACTQVRDILVDEHGYSREDLLKLRGELPE